MKKIRGFEHVKKEEWDKFAGDYPILPRRATENAACYDIFVEDAILLAPNETIVFATGFKVYMLPDECFKIYSRSGLGFKYFARLANGTGVIDSDYFSNPTNDGHCFIKIRNEGDKIMSVPSGTSIAQGMFQKYLIADNDCPIGVRDGGLGSTTKN